MVLADEPTADLDPDTAAILIASLRALADKGASVLIATHDPQVIAALDRSVYMPDTAATEGAQ